MTESYPTLKKAYEVLGTEPFNLNDLEKAIKKDRILTRQNIRRWMRLGYAANNNKPDHYQFTNQTINLFAGPEPPKTIKRKVSTEFLRQHYVKEERSLQEIAEMIGLKSSNAAKRYVLAAGIKLRTRWQQVAINKRRKKETPKTEPVFHFKVENGKISEKLEERLAKEQPIEDHDQVLLRAMVEIMGIERYQSWSKKILAQAAREMFNKLIEQNLQE